MAKPGIYPLNIYSMNYSCPLCPIAQRGSVCVCVRGAGVCVCVSVYMLRLVVFLPAAYSLKLLEVGARARRG